MKCLSCPADAEKDRTRCRPCLDRMRRAMAGRVEQGLCRRCGNDRVPDRNQCKRCLADAAEKRRIADRGKVAAGECRAMGCEAAAVWAGFCPTHYAKNRAYQAKHRAKKASVTRG